LAADLRDDRCQGATPPAGAGRQGERRESVPVLEPDPCDAPPRLRDAHAQRVRALVQVEAAPEHDPVDPGMPRVQGRERRAPQAGLAAGDRPVAACFLPRVPGCAHTRLLLVAVSLPRSRRPTPNRHRQPERPLGPPAAPTASAAGDVASPPLPPRAKLLTS